ncbi:MAG TPA: trigger factor [Gammaproteobacteria bacterium]|nr:trigger factor [Gammaproteobacteria bacterium]
MNAAVSNNNIEVSIETAAGLERRMTVRLPNATIDREVDARLAKVGKTAKLKGFRPGKVPPKVVRQYYGGQVRDEVLTDLIRSSYSRAIAQQKLNPAGGPRIEALPASDGAEHFSYRAIFEVYPEIALAPLESLTVEVPKVEIGDADVTAMIDKLRAQRATWEPVDRAAVAGDRVVVDFTGTLAGEPFQGGQGKDVAIVVGSGQVIEDFDKALEGMTPGAAKTAPVAFPAHYPTASLAGKNAQFEIRVERVEERRLPELDEAFAASFGVSGGDNVLGALEAEVRKNMERELAERLKAEVKTRVFDSLLRANSVSVPRSLVEQEIDTLQADAMRQMGVKDPKDAPARERFAALAERRVSVGLLVQELLSRNQIRLDEKRVSQRIEELAAPYEKPDEAAQFYRSNRGMMAQVEATVLEDQVVDFVLQRAQSQEQARTFQQFMGA